MSITSLTPVESKLRSKVQTLHAYKRSMPKDRPADSLDLQLAARNVLSTHNSDAELKQILGELRQEREKREEPPADDMTAIIEVIG